MDRSGAGGGGRRGGGEEEEERRRRRRGGGGGEEEDQATNIKSNNPHLAGGESERKTSGYICQIMSGFEK